MRSLEAFAKINLGLIVGPTRPDGKHEIVTVLQRIGLADTIEVEEASPAKSVVVEGFEDTVVRAALAAFAEAAERERGWRVQIHKRIPVAAGLGGGSSDAAAALQLANELSGTPLGPPALHEVAARVGADVPFFLQDGARLATGDGTDLAPLDLPTDLPVVLVLPHGTSKDSTAAIYRRFDDRAGSVGFEERRDTMFSALERLTSAADLDALPPNDLVSSPLADDLARLGAIRADVSGAGPAVYGLFEDERAAEQAARELQTQGRTWVTKTVGAR
jgi:4-diphosphocytidyl-2-C-methyl-D-erythritol kinase